MDSISDVNEYVVDIPHQHPASPLSGVDRQDEMLRTAQDHITIAEPLILEMEAFYTALEPQRKQSSLAGLRSCIRSLERELDTLRDVASQVTKPGVEETTLNTVNKRLEATAVDANRCSIEWDILKRCRAFTAMSQVFQSTSKEHRRQEISSRNVSGKDKDMLQRTLRGRGKIEVHVVDWGREWIDVRTLQEDRLARQMADGGWAWGEHSKGEAVEADEWEDIPLAKQIQRLVAAAKLHRHQYQIPRIRVVLPNVSRTSPDIDILLDQLSLTDPLVQITIEDKQSTFMTTPPPTLNKAIANLVGDELETLTPTLNLDHTVLIDLISDITHLELQPQPWQTPSTRTQIKEENAHRGFMIKTLCPVLEGRKLVCTKEAAEHFHNLLKTVGTETEKERGRLLVPFDVQTQSMTKEDIRQRFQSLSTHDIPSSAQIPITILTEDWSLPAMHLAVEQGRLPLVALDVARASGFKSSKMSIFAYGWVSGNVTVTSNKEIRGQICTWLEAHRHHDREMGPAIWRIDVTRNLLAKNVARPEQRGVDEIDEVDESDMT